MNQGYIQQIGTPQEVYSDPDNIFTAGFVGSPAMNFFNAKVLTENEIEIYNQKISLNKQLQEIVNKNNLVGKEVIFAIRPEFFNNNSENFIEVTPTLIELLGNEKLVHFAFEDKKFCAKLPQEFNIEENKPIKLPFDMDKAFLFNAETEERIR